MNKNIEQCNLHMPWLKQKIKKMYKITILIKVKNFPIDIYILYDSNIIVRSIWKNGINKNEHVLV